MMRTCLECQTPIVGRADKKFCNDTCRVAYNNKQNQSSNNLLRNINNRLKKNYRILSELNKAGKMKISRQKLVNSGFDFGYITQIITYKNGSQYQFVYNEGYKLLDEEWVLLVRKEK